MKIVKGKIFICLMTAFVVICALSGCRKVSHNGKLDGQWQIMKIENLETSEEIVPENRMYICFNLHVVQLTSVGFGNASGNMQYDKKAGILNWDFPYNTDESGLNRLSKWGIYTNPVRLEVLKINGSTLILKTPETIITCRRF